LARCFHPVSSQVSFQSSHRNAPWISHSRPMAFYQSSASEVSAIKVKRYCRSCQK
jgi:hypothetical protein